MHMMSDERLLEGVTNQKSPGLEDAVADIPGNKSLKKTTTTRSGQRVSKAEMRRVHPGGNSDGSSKRIEEGIPKAKIPDSEAPGIVVPDDNTCRFQPAIEVPNPEVLERPRRRRFTAKYKLRILKEIDSATLRGESGAILRREGLYSSHIKSWRKQRERGALAGLSPKKRGTKPVKKD
ncbi:MAG: helix-turn-helix domain containing protein, partial [Candidatus Eremiobacteraeota bacterium]|nr:helix-turn-helix domain containing protein [Candidatus Eremiobacteraeota bacterium]